MASRSSWVETSVTTSANSLERMMQQPEGNPGLKEVRDHVSHCEEISIEIQQILHLHQPSQTLQQKREDVLLKLDQKGNALQAATAAVDAAEQQPSAAFQQQVQEMYVLEDEADTIADELKILKHRHFEVEDQLFQDEADCVAYAHLQAVQRQQMEEIEAAQLDAAVSVDAAVAAIRLTSTATRRVVADSILQAADEATARALQLEDDTAAEKACVTQSEDVAAAEAPRSKDRTSCADSDTVPAAAVAGSLKADQEVKAPCTSCLLPVAALAAAAPHAASLRSLSTHGSSARSSVCPLSLHAAAQTCIMDRKTRKLKAEFLLAEKQAIVAALRDVVSQVAGDLANLNNLLDGWSALP